MHGLNLFTELSIILVIAAAMSSLMYVLRQPLIIGHILTGIIVGPAFLHIISDETVFVSFSSIGVALLLFIVGLELSIRVFSRLGKIVSTTALVQILSITGIGMLTAKLLDFTNIESFIIGLALALSSTLIIIKIYNDKKETTRLYAQIAIGILLIQDLVATGAKIFLTSQKSGVVWLDLVALAGRGIIIMLALYLASRYLLPKLTASIENSKELLLVFSLGWALGIATLFEFSGFSIEIGALFAGVSFASLPYAREIASRLKPLRDFFIIIFFIVLGSSLVFTDIKSALLPVALFSLIIIFIKPLVVLISMGTLGYTKKTSFKTAVSLAQISEFSLIFVISAVSLGIINKEIQAIISLVALLTFAASTYMMKYDDELFERLEKRLSLFERRVTKLEQSEAKEHYPVVLFGYRKGGIEFIKTFKSMNKRFVVVDYDPEAIELIEKHNAHFIYGDATDLELLEEVHLVNAKLVVSTMSDYKTNEFLADWLKNNNPQAVFICSCENARDAGLLYNKGAAYVMMPHFIGSEKISTFIKRSGLSKTEFNKFRDRHMHYIETHLGEEPA